MTTRARSSSLDQQQRQEVREEIRGGSVNLARRRLWTNAFPTEALCTRSLERYRAALKLSNKQGASALRRLGEVAAAATRVLKTPSQARSTPQQMAHP
jgi:hypothetical protein